MAIGWIVSTGFRLKWDENATNLDDSTTPAPKSGERAWENFKLDQIIRTHRFIQFSLDGSPTLGKLTD